MALFSSPSRNNKLFYKLVFGFIHLKCISYKLKRFTWSGLWSAYSEHIVVYVINFRYYSEYPTCGIRAKKMTMQPFNIIIEPFVKRPPKGHLTVLWNITLFDLIFIID